MGVSWPFLLFLPVIVQALPSLFHYITLIYWQPTPIFLPGKPHGWRSPAGYSPQGHKTVRQSWWTGHRSREQRGGGRPRKPTVESAAIAPCCHKGALWETVSNRRSGQIPEGTCQDGPAGRPPSHRPHPRGPTAAIPALSLPGPVSDTSATPPDPCPWGSSSPGVRAFFLFSSQNTKVVTAPGVTSPHLPRGSFPLVSGVLPSLLGREATLRGSSGARPGALLQKARKTTPGVHPLHSDSRLPCPRWSPGNFFYLFIWTFKGGGDTSWISGQTTH